MTQKSWDDIDLGGLSMEGQGDSAGDEKNLEKREQERIDLEKLKQLVFDLGDTIPVEIDNPSANRLLEGTVQDVSPLGVRIASAGNFSENDIVRLVFSIGKHRMTMRGEVRWVKKEGGQNVFGIRFINPDEREVGFITSIFTAMHLR